MIDLITLFFVWAVLGFSLGMLSLASGTFVAALLIRVFGMRVKKIALYLGATISLFGFAGALIASYPYLNSFWWSDVGMPMFLIVVLGVFASVWFGWDMAVRLFQWYASWRPTKSAAEPTTQPVTEMTTEPAIESSLK